jgi:hypothetical protein
MCTCGDDRIMHVSAKCSDLCYVSFPNGHENNGYVPNGVNIGGGDYINIKVCMNCGKIQGEWPLPVINRHDQECGEDYNDR